MHPAPIEPLFVAPDARAVAVEVLSALSTVRLATVRGLVAFGGPSGFDPALLETWARTGIIRRERFITDVVRAETDECVALTALGARELARASGRAHRSGGAHRLSRGGRKVAHDAGLGDAMLAVLALGRLGKIQLRGVETDDRVLGSSVAFRRADGQAIRTPLQPDAYVLTAGEYGPRGLLVEYDRATTSVARMREKYEAYAAWREADGPSRTFQVKAMRVLTIVPDEARLARLHDAALEANGGRRSGFLLFAVARDIDPRDPDRLTGPVALPLGGEARVPLFP